MHYNSLLVIIIINKNINIKLNINIYKKTLQTIELFFCVMQSAIKVSSLISIIMLCSFGRTYIAFVIDYSSIQYFRNFSIIGTFFHLYSRFLHGPYLAENVNNQHNQLCIVLNDATFLINLFQ